MALQKHVADHVAVRNTMLKWLEYRIGKQRFDWLVTTSGQLSGQPKDWQVYTSFSSVPRHTGKDAANLSDDELKQAADLRKGWYPYDWTLDQLGRAVLLLSYADQEKNKFLDTIEKIFVSSDWGEAEILYRALPLYPYPEEFKEQTAEGVRSNITPVFNAIALNNPYPAEYLDEGAYNQIVLKALFVGSPVYKIYGLDERANPTLATILIEYAHERWSAGRPVSPELWRAVGPFLSEENTDEITRVFDHPDAIQQKAAALALLSSDFEGKKAIAEKYQSVIQDVQKSGISWDDIGKQLEQTSEK